MVLASNVPTNPDSLCAMMDLTFDPCGGSYGLQTAATAAATARNVVVVVVTVAG